jgi:type III restriction enzyme
MKLQFDGNQPYQLAAVQAVVGTFEQQALAKGDFEISFAAEGASIVLTDKGIGNSLTLTEEQLLSNVQTLQKKNGIPVSENLISSYSDDNKTEYTRLNFTVEMETGTGKTYTYLRTIYELNNVYGFKKFVIVVPSVAVREGTIKNLEITHEHFQALYGNPPVNFKMYDSKNITTLRNYATSNAIQILVINIDSFSKDSNIINSMRETGVKPIEYIRATNPIVIVDEPQNMETDIRRAAIHNLNPLCTFRYSATHRNLYNLLYNLNPVQAYDLSLVKQIEVDGVSSSNNYNSAYISVKGIQLGKRNLKAKLNIYVNDKGSTKTKDVLIEVGADLYDLSNGRDIYKDGFILNSIKASEREIEFSNGIVIREGETQGGLTDEIMKYQIERTIKWHFDKLKRLKPKGIKVLSLFFIDRVANYRDYDSEGNTVKGKFALWFEESFKRLLAHPNYENLIPFSVSEVHNGYFSSDKKGKNKEEIWTDTKGTTAKDDDTYSLIMKEKERLLNIDEPLQFIFSHTALREGWDNPNVFQICTLNESKSELRKRQEIGRGLRLAVDYTGKQVKDKYVNVLTVIANETYEDFSKALQREIESETSVDFTGRIKNASDKAEIRLTKRMTLENYPILFDIWERISHKTRYKVEYSSKELIRRTVEELKDFNRVPLTKRPLLEARKAHLKYTDEGIEATLSDANIKKVQEVRYQIPDVYGYVQSRIDITRATIFEILKQSGRYTELESNPQLFLDNVIGAIQRTLNSLLVDGVKYERINGQQYEMSLFEKEEIETYLSSLFRVSREDKTLFNYIPVDSSIESTFARDCEADENVKFFFKLPKDFLIPTPIDKNYRPDWALVFENDKRIYFVIETKSTLDPQLLRNIEQMKLECGKKHFAVFKDLGVEYRLAVTTKDLH